MNSLFIKIVLCSSLSLVICSTIVFCSVESIILWYPTLVKPSWNPPNWVFGPIWSILYLMIGASFALLWDSTHRSNRLAMVLFLAQFILNLFWSIIFFVGRNVGFAFIEIIILLFLIIATMFIAKRVSLWATILLVPYLLWVSFAAILTGTIYFLNL